MKRIIYIVLSFITLISGFYGSYLLAFHHGHSPLGLKIDTSCVPMRLRLNKSIESNLKKIYAEELREKRKKDSFKDGMVLIHHLRGMIKLKRYYNDN